MRFVSIRLSYGALEGDFVFPGEPRPVLIGGPNGAGKSTLLESLPRTLFGFRRKVQDEREHIESRVPWSGRGCRATVTLETADGRRIRVERDFETDEVLVTVVPEGAVLFRGEARCGGSKPEARRYRELVREWTGFDGPDPYRRTAWIRQGDLRETRLTEDLLRVAEGGHAATGTARELVRSAYYELTRKPLADGERERRDDRRLEILDAEVAGLKTDLAAAREAERTRAPLHARAAELRRDIARLDRELEALDAALGPLSERRALESEEREARQRLERLEEAERSLTEELREFREARDTWEALGSTDLYPDDFEERVGALRVLWEERDRLAAVAAGATDETADARPAARRGKPFGSVALGFLGLVGGSLLLALDQRWIGAVLLAVGVAGALAAFRRLRDSRAPVRDPERERIAADLREREGRIAESVAVIPDGGTLTPDTLPDRRREFERQREARRRLEARRRRLAEAVKPAESGLGGGAGPNPEAEVETAARRLLESVRGAASSARLDVAAASLRDAENPADLALPEGVSASIEAVEAARVSRRETRAEAAGELAATERRLASERVREGSIALEDRLRAREEERTRLVLETEAHRAAFRLLVDAYEDFRSRDQERLARAVSRRLADVTGGELGPLEVQDSLEEARLKAFGRDNPLTSPPLSFGQLQAARFAVRLGAVDFLAGVRIHPPLLVDEPFAWLDEERAAAAWSLLCGVARTRQVIVTSQDRLLLEHLGVEPDIRLPRP